MWVRNQNRKILTNGIISYIASGDEIFLRNENNSNDNSGYFKLAKYSTEEKALKVLDMIQEKINQQEEFKAQGEERRGTSYRRMIEFVFQMPQDSEV